MAYQQPLGDMPPSGPAGDHVDRLARHSKSGGESFVGDAFSRHLSDQANALFGQLGTAASFADRSPAFISHVIKVVPLRAQKQMVRANARWVVTVVTDEKRRRSDGAIVKSPRVSVRPGRDAVDIYSPVPKRVLSASPYPAVIGPVDVSPKLFFSAGNSLPNRRQLPGASRLPPVLPTQSVRRMLSRAPLKAAKPHYRQLSNYSGKGN